MTSSNLQAFHSPSALDQATDSKTAQQNGLELQDKWRPVFFNNKKLVMFQFICIWLFFLLSRQWPEVYDLCHTFLHLRESKNLLPWENRVRLSHGSRCFYLHNVQKRETQIWYLGPLPIAIPYFVKKNLILGFNWVWFLVQVAFPFFLISDADTID